MGYLLETILVPHLPFTFGLLSAPGLRISSVKLTMPGNTTAIDPNLAIKSTVSVCKPPESSISVGRNNRNERGIFRFKLTFALDLIRDGLGAAWQKCKLLVSTRAVIEGELTGLCAWHIEGYVF